MKDNKKNGYDLLDNKIENRINVEKKIHPCKICCCCLCSPIICCFDCVIGAHKENKKLVLFLIISFTNLVIGIIIFKLYYPNKVLLWILGILVASFLPILIVILAIIWIIIKSCVSCYKRTERELTSMNKQNDGFLI